MFLSYQLINYKRRKQSNKEQKGKESWNKVTNE